MHAFSRWLALATVLSGAAAYADQNDLQISRLGKPNEAVTCTSSPCPTGSSQFQAFARAYAASLSSVNLMPPESLGHAGFNVNAELSVVNLPSSVQLPTESTQPGTMLVPSFHVRKGLPFSVELGGRVGWVEKSRMVAATGEVKWAINEGFPYLPDLGVRGHATRLFGARDLGLTDVGLDAGIGKPFPVGGMVTFTPYAGLDFNFVGANSNSLDFNLTQTYAGSLQGNSVPLVKDAQAYKRATVFDNRTQRLYGGVRFIGGVLQIGAEVSFTRLGTVKLDPSNDASDSRTLPTVVTFNTSLGLDF